MSFLTGNGTLSYNGVSFNAPLGTFKTRVSGKPEWDEARRTVTCVEWTIIIEGYIQSGSGTGSTLDDIRSRLMRPAAELHYDAKGFGTLTVNATGGTVWDVDYGPKPFLFEFTPMGPDNACHVLFQVKTKIAQCPDGVGSRFMAFNWEAVTVIDNNGRTSLNYTGYLEIPLTRPSVGSDRVTDHIDRYREEVYKVFPLLPGMERSNQEYRFSKDRRRVDFAFSDKEREYPLPTWIASAHIRQTITSAMNSDKTKGFVTWRMNLSGTLVATKFQGKASCFLAFMLILRSRVESLLRGNMAVLADNISMDDDDIFGESVSFSVSVLVIFRNPSLNALSNTPLLPIDLFYSIAQKAGMWTPVRETSYAEWQQSLKFGGPNSPRGWLDIKFNPQDDRIIDLCQHSHGGVSGGKTARRQFVAPLPPWPTPPNLTPGTSWLDWRNEVRYREIGTSVAHKPLAPVQTKQPPRKQPNAIGAGLEFGGAAAAAPDVIQQLAPKRIIEIAGGAIRIGFRAPPPDPPLIRLRQAPTIVEAGRKVAESIVGNIAGLPIWLTTWRIEYNVPDQPIGNVKQNPQPYVDPRQQSKYS